jgi:ubiquitin carboxyl-terminal hydrolase L5
LFKWVKETSADRKEPLRDYDPELFFANQVINDACATYALLSILMNRSKDFDIGDELVMLREFTLPLGSKDRGWAIGNSEVIRTAHNSFHRQDPFEIEYTKDTGKGEDAFHFISYVPFNGQLYELDGLQKGPIAHGACTEDTWLALARDEIQKRIQRYETSEIRFNLLALVGDKKCLAEKEITRLRRVRAGL